MKSTDKILVGIVVGVVFVVLAAFVLVLTQQADTYLISSDPEAVVHNYLLAIQNEDYERAYTYLSEDLPGRPDSIDAFANDLDKFNYGYYADEDANLIIVSSDVSSRKAAVVVNKSNQSSSRMFFLNSLYLSDFDVTLVLENGEWKISDSSDYFAYCWRNSDGCFQ